MLGEKAFGLKDYTVYHSRVSLKLEIMVEVLF